MLISIFRGGGAASAPPERHQSAMIFASTPDAATQTALEVVGEHCRLEEVEITGHHPPAKGSLDLALKRRPSQVSQGTIFIRYGHYMWTFYLRCHGSN